MLLDHLKRLHSAFWRQCQRHCSRRQLLRLDDHLLDDIGIDRIDAQREGRKPFWK
ncbi:hypothetical protein L861_20575 [Litchfieldella anticariensis FP35 = DSM 16096]|uniref:YjiS-like domain-containing protein n=1 Tax=Litchfieldella anticariensis (strain DSM 16096 / CECT 5854 / CIP 108499 / LMG 22089 / FP35) TaxID=1121939 RepID=S2LBF6_LITA3|nr:DUF1127 domain-containing protein [Halomonas anticariensis]EPC02051.1 hypothetical protein L861_20575 [Halomonas anticariensis FP35 = DSM 16096]